jgi:flagellar hook-length control protein FliK
MKRRSYPGLSRSIHAAAKIRDECERKLDTLSIRPHPRTTARLIRHPSTAMTNDIAASLLAWQNAGAQQFRTHPLVITADLEAIMNRSAALVIAGLLVFEQSTTATQHKENAKSDLTTAITKPLSIANVAKIGLYALSYSPKIT